MDEVQWALHEVERLFMSAALPPASFRGHNAVTEWVILILLKKCTMESN